ncbi:unnamed protein product [Rotaria sp. Silwood2]|nr:unnamed protein product [Rotaria sp. Silwood2]CAF4740563.1 unnamed protein product [Rotaria sp. Silwood2]
MASAPKYGLILLGNSGAGKSFLANRILDDDKAFESRFSAKSVTRHTEWKEMTKSIKSRIYLVANIPGLLEADQKLVDENRNEIMNAFKACPLAIVIFVFGHKNGRIPDEDLVAFTRINDAYEFSPQSLLIVINGIPSNQIDDYETRTADLIHQLTHANKNHIYFIKKSTSEETDKIISDLLHKGIEKCEPTYHEKKHDIQLIIDEISQLKALSRIRQDQILAQQEEHSKRKKSSICQEPMLQHPHSQPQRSSIETVDPICVPKEEEMEFNEYLKAQDKQFNETSAEIDAQFHDPHRLILLQLAEQIQRDSNRNREMVANISTPPDVNIVTKKSGNPVRKALQKVGKVIGNAREAIDGFFYQHPKNLNDSEQDHHSYQDATLSSHPSNPAICKHQDK